MCIIPRALPNKPFTARAAAQPFCRASTRCAHSTHETNVDCADRLNDARAKTRNARNAAQL
eukprot:1626322-Lingulodinium_polyedra.AAC.1